MNTTFFETEVIDIQIGDEVWMDGSRFGTITKMVLKETDSDGVGIYALTNESGIVEHLNDDEYVQVAA